MPEGDTVRRLADKITERFAGQRCQRCVTRDPRLVGVDFTGALLVEAEAHGKHLLIRWDDGRTLYGHLLMTGSWSVGPVSTEPEWKRRAELWMETGRLTAEAVPLLRVIPSAEEGRLIGHLGPDLCGSEPPDPQIVVDRLSAEPAAMLAAALLDQRNVAGFGNLYAVELPFIVAVSPFEPVGAIDGLEALIGLGAAVIRVNAERGPQNTTGRRLHDAAHWIYGRARQPCPVCGTRLEGQSESSSPWRRVTVWCPNCQHRSTEGSDTRVAVDLARADQLLALHPARRSALWPSRS